MKAGGTPNHNRIKENLFIEIGIVLEKEKPVVVIPVISAFIFLKILFVLTLILP